MKFKCPEPGCGAQIGGESHQLTDTQGGITERYLQVKANITQFLLALAGINKQLLQVHDWLCANKLSLEVEK